MNLGISKRSLLGLAAGALMTLGVAAPAFAATTPTSGDVAVTGTIANQIFLTITTPPSVDFGALDPSGVAVSGTNSVVTPDSGGSGSCYLAAGTVSFNVQSNRTYNGSTIAATNNALLVGKLHRAAGAGAADCTANPFTLSDASGANWISAATPTGAQTYTDSYAFHVDWADQVGPNYTLTYSVSQA